MASPSPPSTPSKSTTQSVQYQSLVNQLSNSPARKALFKSSNKSSSLSEYYLLMSFKVLSSLCPPGILLLPSIESTFHWEGVLFIHSGLFKGAILTFSIHFPSSFPESPNLPIVQFKSDIPHPLINSETGHLFLNVGFPKWRTQQDQVWHILHFIYYAFYSPEKVLKRSLELITESIPHVFNKETSKPALSNQFVDIAKNIQSFLQNPSLSEMCQQYAAQSIQKFYSSKSHKLPLSKFDTAVHGPFLEQIIHSPSIPE